MDTESVTSLLLDDIEEYLTRRIGLDSEGAPNAAMRLLHRLQDERKDEATTT